MASVGIKINKPEKGLDKQPVQDPKPDLLSTMERENVRGSEYYH